MDSLSLMSYMLANTAPKADGFAAAWLRRYAACVKYVFSAMPFVNQQSLYNSRKGESDMNPSDELKNVMLRYYQSMTSGDVRAVERIFSLQTGVLAIGSDPNEWWEGYDTIARMFKAQLREMGGIQIKAGEMNAFIEGTVGWVADRPTFRLPNGQELTFRGTAIFHKEDGEWKIVHLHHSIGVPNEDAVGKELTTK
jgi:ketosteroid isomerase-like protein